MFKHYLITAWRNFLRYKISTAISVLGLSLGLACFIAAVGAITYFDGSDRHVPDSDRVVVIMERRTATEIDTGFIPHTSSALAEALRREFAELPSVTRYGGYGGSYPTTVNGRTEILGYEEADTEYFQVLNWPKLASTTNDPLAMPFSVALGEDTAIKLFGSSNVLGRKLQLPNGVNLTVSAVLKRPPMQSHVGTQVASVYDITALISSDTAATLEALMTGRQRTARPLDFQWSFSMGYFTYAKLPPDGSLSIREFERRLAGIAERNGAGKDWQHDFRVVPLSDAWLASVELYFLPFESGISIKTTLLLVACLVLGLACANYATLAFAQSLRRAKETGLRRVVGATRAQLGFQSMVEASCHVGIASVLALIIVAGGGAILRAKSGIDVLSAVASSAGFWSLLVAVAILVSITIVLYPAFVLSRIKPSQIVRTSSSISIKGRGALVFLGVQFAVTGALLAVLLVVYQQNSTSRTQALASHANSQIFLGTKWGANGARFETLRSELLRNPAIQAVSAISNRPWTADFGFYPFVLDGPTGPVIPVSMAVHYDFEKALDLKVIAGRSFDRSFGDLDFRSKGQPPIVIDETLARTLGYAQAQDAVGEVIHRSDDDPQPVRVIGVVKDQPMRLLPFLDRTGNAYQLFARMAYIPIIRIDRTRLGEALEAIDATWKKLNPNDPVERHFVDESFERAYAIYKGIGTVLTTITTIALLIAVLGGYGFASFVASRRAHEIGVRKTLGASTSQVVTMLLRDFSMPVLIANIIVWPAAYLAAQKYLSMFVQRIELTLMPFVLSLVLSLLISSLAVSSRAYRAAKVNPAAVLRHE